MHFFDEKGNGLTCTWGDSMFVVGWLMQLYVAGNDMKKAPSIQTPVTCMDVI